MDSPFEELKHELIHFDCCSICQRVNDAIENLKLYSVLFNGYQCECEIREIFFEIEGSIDPVNHKIDLELLQNLYSRYSAELYHARLMIAQRRSC